MKLKYVVAGVNEKSHYLRCVPFFIHAWKSLNPRIEVRVVLFANQLPDFLERYQSSIKLIPPIQGVSTAFCSQIVRLFYPCILPDDGAALISDVDLLPLNFKYFEKALAVQRADKFVTFRADHMKKLNRPEVVMCYNAAYSSVWRDVFGIHDYKGMIEKLSFIYSRIEYEDIHNGKGWRTDQRYLYEALKKWSKKVDQHVEYSDAELDFARMSVENFRHAYDLIKQQKIVDIHLNKSALFSPDSQTRKLNTQIIKSYIETAKKANVK